MPKPESLVWKVRIFLNTVADAADDAMVKYFEFSPFDLKDALDEYRITL